MSPKRKEVDEDDVPEPEPETSRDVVCSRCKAPCTMGDNGHLWPVGKDRVVLCSKCLRPQQVKEGHIKVIEGGFTSRFTAKPMDLSTYAPLRKP